MLVSLRGICTKVKDADRAIGTAPTTANGDDGGDFLARERAALGEDAEQFATERDAINTATVEDGDDDLLGGADDFVGAPSASADPTSEFESSFPAIETQNTVSFGPEFNA